ncbi:myotubularin related protein 6 isoform X2 [Brevipalpus obovatus]|uniref:myotubularin related protein 6 isoform X2 n=1 Tax=Brevipalpus obovatus TaxID=246614 RepID=UPI003D9F381D
MEFIKKAKVHGVRVVDRFSSMNNSNSTSGGGGAGSNRQVLNSYDLIGNLFLTPTHLIFTDVEGRKDIWILHSHLASIEKLSTCTGGTPIHIRCKNFRYITFVIPKEKDAHDIYTSLLQISAPNSVSDLFCFHYLPSTDDLCDDKSKGWLKFDIKREYNRMNIPNQDWIVTSVNDNYSLCDTYPRYLVVPFSADEQTLRESATFRSKSRIPVLTYLHSNGASITRSSQPLPGISNTRCTADERLLRAILASNRGSKCLNIVDTRPMINAIANKAAGKGYEYKNHYGNIKRHFYAIENIHVMRSSLQKLMDESCGWLRHISSVIEAALFVASSVRDGISVMVHCSDGWDRTAQTCALACLMLDPYYRTIDGFEVLIEKEWLAFGHKFTTRCGHIQGSDAKQIAPIFTQFIDCVWQLTQQFPFDFEFNERFLLTLNDHVYSCQYGTFIGDCDKEREEYLVKESTYSLWALFDADITEYTNPLYVIQRKKRALIDFLDVNISPQIIRFWRAMYNRFDTGIHPREAVDDLMYVTFKHIQSLEEHIKYLEEKINEQEQLFNQQNNQESFDSYRSSDNGNDAIDDTYSFPHDDSFDSINSPLRIVRECMRRLQMQHDMHEKERLAIEPNGQESGQDSGCKANDNKVEQSSTKEAVFYEPKTEVPGPVDGLNDESDSLNELITSIKTVALDWQSFRSARNCKICQSAFNNSNTRYHCWGCGKIYCIRCIKKKMILPGHKYTQGGIEMTEDINLTETSSQASLSGSVSLQGPLFEDLCSDQKVPVCLECFKNITLGHSMDYND